MNRFTLPVALAAVAFGTALVRPASAQTTLTFDSIPGITAMGNSPGSNVPVTAQLSNQFLNTSGVSFSSGTGYIAVVSLGLNHATSGTNGIGGTNAAGQLSYAAANPISAQFFVPGSAGGTLGVTNFVSVRADLAGINGNLILQAYDVQGNLIGTNSQVDVNGPTLSLSVAGINRVTITGNGSAAFDDFTFNTVTAVPANTAAPEPGSAALLLPVLGMAGVVVRRRLRK